MRGGRVSGPQRGPAVKPAIPLDFRHILDALADPVVAADSTNHIVYANHAVERLLGWLPDELIGEPLVTIIPPRLRETHITAFERYMRTGEPHIIGRPVRVPTLCRDGQEVDIELSLAALPLEESRPLIVATLRDLRERVEAEEAQERSDFLAEAGAVLASSLDYETTLANVARLAVGCLADWCVVDVLEEGEIRRVAIAHVNPAMVEFAEEVERRYPPNETDPVHRVIQTREPAMLTEISEEQIVQGARDAEHLRILRELAPLSFMCVPLVARETTIGAITFLTSRSSGRIYGPADLALAEDLARRAATAVDNSRLYAEVQEAIRVRDEFLSSVSHDLKNPLATIKARAQVLRRRAARLPGDEAERLVQGLDSIDSTVSKMSRLINDLVDLVHLRIGRPLMLRREPTDLVVLVQQVVAEQLPASEHHIRVVSSVPQLIGDYDSIRLERVLVNLLSNAIKYSPEGRDIVVRVGREDTEQGQMAVIVVADQGIGIPAEDLPRVFERFYRASNAADFAGTGIGLAGALQIVEQHGGTIDVASEEGKGTTFTIRLPLSGEL